MYEWDFGVLAPYQHALAVGLAFTVLLSLTTILFGSIGGGCLALLRMHHLRVVRLPVAWMIEVLRALPVLVLMIWVYYCLPLVTPWRVSAFTSAGIALSLNLGAYLAEVLRAGIDAIPHGFKEAARSLGMTEAQINRRIIIPQAVREMLPAILNMYINALKLTSLASIISVGELLHSGNDIIASTFRPLEVYTAVAVLYLMLILPLSIWFKRFETKSLWLKN